MDEMVPQQPSISEKARKRQERAEARRQGKKSSSPIEPKTQKQHKLLTALREQDVVFAIGPAGTGKTFLPTRVALERAMRETDRKIIITRPTAAKTQHRLGFQPGGVNAKMKPWMVPVMDALRTGASAAEIEKMLLNNQIELVPFEHMRGRTFKNASVIVDEAQNCSFSDLETVITRVGENATLAICGDQDQSDIEDSGLMMIVSMVRRYNINAGIVEFDENDVVRSAIAAEWVKAFKLEKKRLGLTVNRLAG